MLIIDLLIIYFTFSAVGILFSFFRHKSTRSNSNVYYSNNYNLEVNNYSEPKLKAIKCDNCGSSQFDIEKDFLKCKYCGGLTQ